MIDRASRALTYLSILSNMVLGAVIFFRLDITPGDVMAEANKRFDKLSLDAQTLSEDVNELKLQFVQRGELLKNMDSSIAKQAQEAMRVEEFRKWVAEAKRLNMDLNIPDVPEHTTQ